MSDPGPSASMLHKAIIENAERNEISNSARDMFRVVQNNYNFNREGENRVPSNLELHDAIVYLLHIVPPFLEEVRNNDRSRSTVSETTGADGSGPLPPAVSTDHAPQSPIPEDDIVNISDIVAVDPSLLPVSSVADRYTRSLLKCLRGYPLYNPKPCSGLSREYRRNGVNVGDVGFVRGTGTFDFLFNICPSRNSSINPPNLPGGFTLETSECSGTTDVEPLPRNTRFFPSPITQTSTGEYICEGSEGAILELPEGAIQDEAMAMLPFKNLAACYGVQWYTYAMSQGRDISNGSLYLITSSTKCTQWGIAVFDRPCASGQGLTFARETPFPFSLWRSTSNYQWRGSSLNPCTTKVANPDQGDARNQCVFLRGYKIMIRQDIFDNLRKDQLHEFRMARPTSSPETDSSSPTLTRHRTSRIRGGVGPDPVSRLTGGNSLTRTTNPTKTEADEVVLRANFDPSLIHPSDLINDALLSQNPGAKVALTHDDVWCELLRDNFPKLNHATLINIARSYTITLDEYDCVLLKQISSSNSPVQALQGFIEGAKHNPDIMFLNFPPLPSVFFTGQDIYLQLLKDCFSPKLVSGKKVFLLYGMGGIGKTQICLKFIEDYGKKWFSDIFWIDASSEHTIDFCLRQIAQKYKVDSSPSAGVALEWISHRNDWLMVFDNANVGYKVVEKFIPPGDGGSILITSRDRALTRVTSGAHSIEVIELGEEEAVAMLLKSAMINDKSVDVVIAAQKLVAALGCVPLAIDQAGVYMLSCGFGPDYYLKLFSKHRNKLMSDKEFVGASLYKYSTYGTWETSIEEIRHRAEGKDIAQRLAAQSALILHNVFAFFHHDNISQEIIEKAALNFLERKGEKTNGLPQSISLLDPEMLFLNGDGNWDASQFQAGINVLQSFSLIRSNGTMYSIHPLLQAWSRDRIPVENVSDCCKRSRSLLACSLKLDYEKDNYRFCALLAPHIKRNGEYLALWTSDDINYDDQNERFALVFERVGDWDEAENQYIQVLRARETMLGGDHPDTLTAMGNLASTYRNQGRWREAENLEVKAMEARKENLGSSHSATLAAMSNLAFTYKNQGRWREAENLEVKVMEGMKENLGSSHLATLTAMSNLASTYRNQGRWREAENLEVKVMEEMKENLGSSHSATITAMSNLASTYRSQGKWKEAESLEVKVMDARKDILGALHPDTLTAMSNLASTYNTQGKWKEAESLEVKVMVASKEILGELHPHTLIAMANLALTYRDQSKLQEALELLDTSIKGMQQVLGAEHPTTIHWQNMQDHIRLMLE